MHPSHCDAGSKAAHISVHLCTIVYADRGKFRRFKFGSNAKTQLFKTLFDTRTHPLVVLLLVG